MIFLRVSFTITLFCIFTLFSIITGKASSCYNVIVSQLFFVNLNQMSYCTDNMSSLNAIEMLQVIAMKLSVPLNLINEEDTSSILSDSCFLRYIPMHLICMCANDDFTSGAQ